jgi:S-adenosylmethionine-diacylglycerol 3-amino-3-carboxypropyl transferase
MRGSLNESLIRSPLEGGELASLQESGGDEERSEIGYELDRWGICGGFHCYVRR